MTILDELERLERLATKVPGATATAADHELAAALRRAAPALLDIARASAALAVARDASPFAPATGDPWAALRAITAMVGARKRLRAAWAAILRDRARTKSAGAVRQKGTS